MDLKTCEIKNKGVLNYSVMDTQLADETIKQRNNPYKVRTVIVSGWRGGAVRGLGARRGFWDSW